MELKDFIKKLKSKLTLSEKASLEDILEKIEYLLKSEDDLK